MRHSPSFDERKHFLSGIFAINMKTILREAIWSEIFRFGQYFNRSDFSPRFASDRRSQRHVSSRYTPCDPRLVPAANKRTLSRTSEGKCYLYFCIRPILSPILCRISSRRSEYLQHSASFVSVSANNNRCFAVVGGKQFYILRTPV